MNILLIGSNDISSELLEHVQKIVDGSVFLAGSATEALHLVQRYVFRLIVLVCHNDEDLPIFREVIKHSPTSTHIVCDGDIQRIKELLESDTVTWVPDFETLVTFLEFHEERRYQTIQQRQIQQ